MSAEEPARPALRIVRGEPDAAELAALAAVLASAGGGADEAPDPTPTSGWARHADLVREPVRPAPVAGGPPPDHDDPPSNRWVNAHGSVAPTPSQPRRW